MWLVFARWTSTNSTGFFLTEDRAAQSLLNKLIRSNLVDNTNQVEVLQRDPKSPLYSVKSFEELRLWVFVPLSCSCQSLLSKTWHLRESCGNFIFYFYLKKILICLLLWLVNNSHDSKIKKYEKLYNDGLSPTLISWLPVSPLLGRDFLMPQIYSS